MCDRQAEPDVQTCMVETQLARQYKQQSKDSEGLEGMKVIAEPVEQVGWGYRLLGELDGDRYFICDNGVEGGS